MLPTLLERSHVQPTICFLAHTGTHTPRVYECNVMFRSVCIDGDYLQQTEGALDEAAMWVHVLAELSLQDGLLLRHQAQGLSRGGQQQLGVRAETPIWATQIFSEVIHAKKTSKTAKWKWFCCVHVFTRQQSCNFLPFKFISINKCLVCFSPPKRTGSSTFTHWQLGMATRAPFSLRMRRMVMTSPTTYCLVSIATTLQ